MDGWCRWGAIKMGLVEGWMIDWVSVTVNVDWVDSTVEGGGGE